MSVCSSSKAKRSKAWSQLEAECATYTYSDLLTLRPPPSSVVASVPRPRRAKMAGGLPLWDKKPLNAKLPLMQGPNGPIVFTRGNLGEKLWCSSTKRQWQDGDTGVRFDYEPAHDRHLRAWLLRQDTLDILQAQGLVTQRLQVTCTVQQYNNFRQFLYNLYRDSLRNEVEKMENETIEKLMITKAYKNAEKEAAKHKKKEDSNTRRMSNFKKLDKMKMETLEKCKKRLQRVIDRAAQAEEQKKSDLLLRKQRMEAFDERIRSRVIAANNIERKNKIKAMRAWHKQDVEKKKQFEKKKCQRELENKHKAEERWKRKVEEQKKQISKEEYLYDQRKKAKETYQQQYMKVMEKEWIRMEDELNTRKCRGTLDKVRGHRKKSMKQIMQAVSDAYSTRKSLAMLSHDKETIDTLMERIQQTLKEIRYDLEPYIVIAHAKDRLERQENVPLPVSGAIKFLLEQTVVEYTANQLAQTMIITARKVLSAIDELKMPPTVHEIKSVSMKRSSLSAFPRLLSLSSVKTARISDIEVIPVFKSSEELNVTVTELRSTRDRAPTPMPSIETFTELLFKDSVHEEFEEDNFNGFSFVEQKKLNMVIIDVSNRIFRMVPLRVRSVVESRSYDRISTVTGVSVDSLPENKPVSKLCSQILFEDSVRDSDLTQIVDRMILGFMQDIQLTPSYLRFKIKQQLEATKPQS